MRKSKRRYLLKLIHIIRFRQRHWAWVRGNRDAITRGQDTQLRFAIDPGVKLMTLGSFSPPTIGEYEALHEKYRALKFDGVGTKKMLEEFQAAVRAHREGRAVEGVTVFTIDSCSEVLSNAQK